ncbi:TPA: hypothetical protein QHD31_005769 [Raoultella ornithinolytica]|nr:hypothetical protein [Raoultella ornithinolytica]
MTTDITELAQSMKRRAISSNEFGGRLYVKADDVLALVEVLEKAQSAKPCEHSMFWDASGVRRCSKCDIPEHANVHYADAAEMEIAALRQRIAKLTSENAALKGSVENAAGCIDAAYLEGLADVLAESSDERLVDLVKRLLLHAYLPVETPATDDALVAMGDAVLLEQLEDSRKAIVSLSYITGMQDDRIAELEPRTVTVKLPRPGFITIQGKRMAVYLKDDVDAAMLATGIEETK